NRGSRYSCSAASRAAWNRPRRARRWWPRPGRSSPGSTRRPRRRGAPRAARPGGSASASPAASFHPLVPRAIRAFRDAHPLVSLSLDESGTVELAAALRAGRLDAAFVRSPIAPQDDLAVRALLDEAMFAALPTGHPLAGAASPLDLTALAGETLILYRRPLGPGLY